MRDMLKAFANCSQGWSTATTLGKQSFSVDSGVGCEPRVVAARSNPGLDTSKRLRRFAESHVAFWAREARAPHVLGVVGVDGVTFDHAIERTAIDTENLRGARAIASRDLEHVKQIAPFKLVEWWQVLEQC